MCGGGGLGEVRLHGVVRLIAFDQPNPSGGYTHFSMTLVFCLSAFSSLSQKNSQVLSVNVKKTSHTAQRTVPRALVLDNSADLVGHRLNRSHKGNLRCAFTRPHAQW